MPPYTYQLFPQSIYRRTSSDPLTYKSITINLPNLSDLSRPLKEELRNKIKAFHTIIQTALLPDIEPSKQPAYIKNLTKELGLNTTSEKSKEKEFDSLWESLKLDIGHYIKIKILEKYTDYILSYFESKLENLVKQYARHLPNHVSNSESDDLKTIAQLEFLETIKSWVPNDAQTIWPIAYTRIKGAMKDHIRYISKSDPSRFYDWINDAAQVYLLQKDDTTFESKIEDGIQLNEAMACLSSRDKEIVNLHIKEDKTFQQIGIILNLSESHVSRLYKKIITTIKRQIKKDEINSLRT